MAIEETLIDRIGESCSGTEFIECLIEITNDICKIYGIDYTRTRFLTVVKRRLEKGKIKFIAPGADCYISSENPSPRLSIGDKEAHWHAEPEEVVRYRDPHWPVDALSVHDIEIVEYTYNMPGLFWIRDDGLIHHWSKPQGVASR